MPFLLVFGMIPFLFLYLLLIYDCMLLLLPWHGLLLKDFKHLVSIQIGYENCEKSVTNNYKKNKNKFTRSFYL